MLEVRLSALERVLCHSPRTAGRGVRGQVCTISGDGCDTQGVHHTKSLYRLTPQAVERLQVGFGWHFAFSS